MSQKVTLGGDRVGSGKKMQAELHDYYRSTHNLSERFTSSMASGILYPCLCKLAMRGDTFDIDINADARTIPTVAPLFGSYKMQIDVYQAPVRLYQGILHNNPLAIGLNMSQVKFPTLKIMTTSHPYTQDAGGKFSESCLLTYLGMRGLGRSAEQQSKNTFGRIINALPALSYYDIFKTYYANKQEENAYVITPKNIEFTPLNFIAALNSVAFTLNNNNNKVKVEDPTKQQWLTIKFSNIPPKYLTNATTFKTYCTAHININNNTLDDYRFEIVQNKPSQQLLGIVFEYWAEDNESFDENPNFIEIVANEKSILTTSDIQLTPFKLSNIDDMRYDLLGHHELGTSYTIDNNAEIPPFCHIVHL